MIKRLLLFSTALTLATAAAFAQTVTGRVTASQDNSPLPGVSVLLKGTTVGTTTDADGRYTISASNASDAIITFSFIGFTPQEVSVGNRTTVDVILVEDISELSEVVVTAMGYEQEKGNIGYAVTSIKGDDMTKAGVTQNPLVALYGRAPGVQIAQGAAGPTGGINIRIRGAATMNTDPRASSRPLFVVDGVVIHDQNTSMENRGYDPLNSFDYGSGINDLNPNDIESLEILSGAKATALYGSLGANGVVLITSKKGKNTKGVGVQLSYQHTFEKPYTLIDFQDEYGSGESVNRMDSVEVNGQMVRSVVANRTSFGPKYDGSPVRFFDGSTIPYQSNAKQNFMDMFRAGHTDNLSLSIAGSSDFGNMRLAYSRDDYQGIMNNFTRTRNTIAVNGQIKASKMATFEVNTSINSIETQNRLPNIQDIVAWGFNGDYPMAKLQQYYLDSTGYKRNSQELEDLGLSGTFVPRLFNTLWEQNQNRDTDKKIHLIGSVKSTLNLTNWLSWVTFAGLDYTDTDYTTMDRMTQIIPSKQGGRYAFGKANAQVETYNTFLNFDKSLASERLNVFAFVGTQYQRFSENRANIGTYGTLMFPDWYSLKNESSWPDANNKEKVRTNSPRGSNVMYSVMGSTTLAWDGTYYLELTGRNDWNSTLPPGNNSYFYPGAAFTWKFSEKVNVPKLQFGNLRLSWAEVGNGTSRYFTIKNYDITTIPNTNAISIQAPEDLFLGDVGKEYKPERKREVELGFNTKFFTGNRVELDFSYYNNSVFNQIIKVPISALSGGRNIRINAGEIRNRGIEIMLKGTPILTPTLRWDVSITASNQRSRIAELYPGINKITIGGSQGGYLVVAEVGQRYGDIQMFDYLRDDNGNRIVNTSGAYQLDQTKLVTAGNYNPKFFGGFFSDLYYKGFNLHVGLDYKYGGTIFSYSNYYLTGNGITKNTLAYRDEEHGGLAYYLDSDGQKVAWQHNQAAPAESNDGVVYHDGLILPGSMVGPDGETTVPNTRIVSAYDYYTSYVHDLSTDFQSDNLYKNDYVKLRELSLSYTVPQKFVEKVRLQRVTLSLIARNLGYIYKTIPNIDAESALGTNSYYENSFFPTVRSYGFGVNASF